MVEEKEHQPVSAIHPKRTLAFVNHFVIKHVQFINSFASTCESKLMDFEYKMQKLEASLAILEAKLASIPGFDEPKPVQKSEPEEVKDTEIKENKTEETTPEVTKEPENEVTEDNNPRNDPIYSKYFKMIQVGVPLQAVKLKVIQEGLDPNVLG